MKEIGGYFGLETLISNEYYSELLKFNTCRNALIFLLKNRNIKKLYLPYYLCSSVFEACLKYNIEFENYHIGKSFFPESEINCKEDECVYIVNYFCQLTENDILAMKQKYKRIIVDNSQAFFQRPIHGIDTIYSCRKFFGVSDGAYLSADIKLKSDLEVDCSKDRMTHILGRFEGCASDYYNDFKQNDKQLGCENIKVMSKLTTNIMGAVDYQNVMQRRTENFHYLHEIMYDRNCLEIKLVNGAFAYPLYAENGMEIKKKMAEKKIYIPTLWPNVLENMPVDSVEYSYAANILPLPCDQRYDCSDMKRLVEELKCLL